MPKGLIFFDWTTKDAGWGVSFSCNEDESFGYCSEDPNHWSDWDISILESESELSPEAVIRVKKVIAKAWSLSHESVTKVA